MKIAVTSPSGLWDYQNLIGASVRIKSLPIKSGIFNFDSDSTYQIEDIRFRVSRTGRSYASIKLGGIDSREFVWKDLEVIGLRMPLWSPAICGKFCAGNAICGYRVNEYNSEFLGNNNSNGAMEQASIAIDDTSIVWDSETGVYRVGTIDGGKL